MDVVKVLGKAINAFDDDRYYSGVRGFTLSLGRAVQFSVE